MNCGGIIVTIAGVVAIGTLPLLLVTRNADFHITVLNMGIASKIERESPQYHLLKCNLGNITADSSVSFSPFQATT